MRKKKEQDGSIKDLRQSFANAPRKVREQLASQFEPLVNKIVAQQSKILKTDWDTLKSMGNEGLAMAMNSYDPDRSKMTFTQYAAFAILNNIRNCSPIELHTVKLTTHMQARIKNKEIMGSTFETRGISALLPNSESESCVPREMRYGIYESAKFADGDPMEVLFEEVRLHCNITDAECFFKYYGVCGYEEQTVQDIAKDLNVTSGRISQRIKRVVTYIQGDEVLCETLRTLIER